jgi:flagellar protein FliS
VNPIRRYGSVQAETASPQRVMVLLFETALKHIRNARACFADGRRREAVLLCTKASDIVIGLESTLDKRHAPELCEELAAIYQFTCSRLLLAATAADGSAALVHEAERAFAPLVDGFSGAVEKVARGA